MIEILNNWDTSITVWINQHYLQRFDEIMWLLSSSSPFLLLMTCSVYYSNRKYGMIGMWVFLIFLLVAFSASDLISVRVFKEHFMRLRPSHDPNIRESLRYYLQSNGELYIGGPYGFVSSHAANFATLIIITILHFKPKIHFFVILILMHLLVIYSRIYLGVHFLGDVIVGSMVGIVCGFLVWRITKFQFTRWKNLAD